MADNTGSILAKRPDLAWAVNHPELGPLLARIDEMGDAEFAAALYNTTWWKTHGEKERHSIAEEATDPRTHELNLAETYDRVWDMAHQLTSQWGQEALRFFEVTAKQAYAKGWTDDQIRDELVRFASPGGKQGALNSTWAAIRQRGAREFGLPVSDQTAWQWSKAIASGEMTTEDLDVIFRDQAVGLYAGLAKQLELGMTVREAASPYIEMAARELELNPDTIDLSDAKWNRAINQVDKEGNRTAMSLGDWQRTLRTDEAYGWDRTTAGRQAGYEMLVNMGRAFGKVA